MSVLLCNKVLKLPVFCVCRISETVSEATAPYVDAFGEILNGPFAKYVALSNEIGDIVKTQVSMSRQFYSLCRSPVGVFVSSVSDLGSSYRPPVCDCCNVQSVHQRELISN